MVKQIRKLDQYHLEWMGLPVIAILLAPLLYLCYRDGLGSFVFAWHDQLDEIILNYVFPARYTGASVYEQMMCGLPVEGLKPFAPLFVVFYQLFDVYIAFLLQYVVVVTTAFYGMYFCVKRLTDSSVSALIAAGLFSMLPVHSIYGNVVMGTPLLLYCVLLMQDDQRKKRIAASLGIVFYGLTTGLILSGWVALCIFGAYLVLTSLYHKKVIKPLLYGFLLLLVTYVLCNLDLFAELFSFHSFVSHRIEFGLTEEGVPFLNALFGILTNGSYLYEAEAKHVWIALPVVAAGILLFFVKSTRRYRVIFVGILSAALGTALVYAFCAITLVIRLRQLLPGMLSSFQVTRFYYLFPGFMYILLGVSCAVIIHSLSDNWRWLSILGTGILCLPTLFYLAKDPNGIFYQNINQINNGEEVTGYITMRNLYSENVMQEIEDAIGKDITSYRVASIGINPVVSLMHGFYTIDGYSNNYPLEYKHSFRRIIAGELEQNEYIRAYFDQWGSRCYLFYHKWGNAHMLGKTFDGELTDLQLDFDAMKDFNCRYIFSAGPIVNCEAYGLKDLGNFTDEESYWNIRVYEIL